MPRQLILCCDGTNNTLTGRERDSNVLKPVDMLDPETQGQLLYYDPGVGAPDTGPATNFWDRAVSGIQRLYGLAHGKGIYENIAAAYEFLVRNYREGDQVFLFGFSRGAFTVRCVAGMVNLFGLIRPECTSLLGRMIDVYFMKPGRGRRPAQRRETIAAQIRDQFTDNAGRVAIIHFVGVWDTVASVGLPGSKVSITSDGTTSTKRMLHVRQALALDEHRASFQPRLYWEAYEGAERSVRQRWFSGAHSDVGGGYPLRESLLSNEALEWMADQAVGKGLRLDPCLRHSSRYDAVQRQPVVIHSQPFASPYWGVAGLWARSLGLPKAARESKNLRCPYEPQLEQVRSAGRKKVWPWHASGYPTGKLFVVTLLCIMALLVTGALGGASMTGHFNWRYALPGGIAFDGWQRSWICGLANGILNEGLIWTFRWLCDVLTEPVSLPVSFDRTYALMALTADLGLIAAYAWLLGLFSIVAFAHLAGQRWSASEVLYTLNILGCLPCVSVLADLAENLITALVIVAGSAGIPVIGGTAAILMGVMNVLKWTCLSGSAVLIVSGMLLAHADRPER